MSQDTFKLLVDRAKLNLRAGGNAKVRFIHDAQPVDYDNVIDDGFPFLTFEQTGIRKTSITVHYDKILQLVLEGPAPASDQAKPKHPMDFTTDTPGEDPGDILDL